MADTRHFRSFRVFQLSAAALLWAAQVGALTFWLTEDIHVWVRTVQLIGFLAAVLVGVSAWHMFRRGRWRLDTVTMAVTILHVPVAVVLTVIR